MEILPVKGMPLIKPGDDLPAVIAKTVSQNCISLENGDVLVLAQKIVSKAEGRVVDLNSVTPGARALQISEDIHKDPRVVELILSESKSIKTIGSEKFGIRSTSIVLKIFPSTCRGRYFRPKKDIQDS